MTTDKRFDEAVSKWLEEDAPARLPERVLDTTFERTRESRQHVGWRAWLARFRGTRLVPALGGAAIVVMAAALGINYYGSIVGVGGPADIFAGDWEAIDDPPDSSHLTMTLILTSDGTYDVTIRDDVASVCGGTPSTMTGVAAADGPRTIVMATPHYACDDGSEAQALSGPPLEEQLRNMRFAYDAERNEIDSGGLVWSRVEVGQGGSAASATAPAASDVPAAAFAGDWEATDAPPDSSHLTMTLIPSPDGTYEVIIRDDLASVCDGASSTMTGVAEANGPDTIVIAHPDYVCDDGSEAKALSGPPLAEQLADMGFTYDPVSDELYDSLGLIWSRQSAGS